jgi:hypothetical protein
VAAPGRRGDAVAAGILASVVLLAAGWIGGARGVAYLGCYAFAISPGLFLGVRLFGRSQGAGWIAGGLLGYAMTAAGIWLASAAGLRGPAAVLAAWAGAMAMAMIVTRRLREPLVALPSWTRRDTAALCGTLLIVPLLVAVPFARVGETDEAGTHKYRAYFTADLVWHVALTSQLAHLDLPPRDPYFNGERLHYYWTFFLVPAAIAHAAPRWYGQPERALLVNALASGVLFIGMVFVFTWCVVPRAGPAAAATLFAVIAPSAEGAYAIVDVLRHHASLNVLRELNVDAVTHWWFRSLSIDDLPRALWYTPQHASACALGLVALVVGGLGSGATALSAIGLAGAALAFSLMMSPFLGGAFALVFGLTAALRAMLDMLQARAAGEPLAAACSTVARRIARFSLAALPVVLSLAACARAGMFSGVSGVLRVGYSGPIRFAPLLTPALALGPLLLVCIPGIFCLKRTTPARWAALMGCGVGLLLFYGVTLGGTDDLYVGWRAGQILLVCLPALAAAGFAALASDGRFRMVGTAIVAVVFLVGSPTTVIDAFNAQDVEQSTVGPGGFRWTVSVSAGQMAALRWIRTMTTPDAVVQMDVVSRGRETWTLIPTFAQRRMAAGLPISLVLMPYHEIGARRMKEIYRSTDAKHAWLMAQANHIDFFYVDDVERRAYGTSLAKFDEAPACFQRVFHNADAQVYAVLPNGLEKMTVAQSSSSSLRPTGTSGADRCQTGPRAAPPSSN